ncbi:probable arabinosyltransferase ARAD1 isoform X2 [Lycium barbarum]|uniref:probable arabinosyltransferase ARAD1 isoform X2 n=1 Tax=Lycium barbarum TaxID=112863 RepID=UPI00293E7293|nr:probable arabinosyltransferase ARAD1 isoform X2 [Lycium barbarum]
MLIQLYNPISHIQQPSQNMTSNKCLVSCFTIFTLFIFASLLLFYCGKTIDYRSKFLLFSSPPTDRTPCTTQSPPLNVYMYDLGTKYNVGMLNGSGLNGPPVTRETLPEYPNYVGLRRQHTVEYWMLASLLLYNGTTYGEAVRVLNPDLADVFFVPFFSSLSYDTYNHHGNYSESKVDDQLQAEIVDLLQKSKYWKRSAGRDHVIPMQHPNAFKRYREKEGKDRKQLEKILSGQKDVVFEVKEYSEEGVNASTKGMRSSKFCLDPAGDTPSSCRLFDAIVSHCVPVIVSDKIELPYEDEIDYKKFSIFFSREEAKKEGYILDQLRNISKPKWVEMWRYLKNITHHFEYQYPPKNGDAVNMIWRQVKHKLPAVKLAVHRNRRLKVPDWWR